MPTSSQRRPSGASTVYDLLREQIIDGTLESGSRLTELDLARSLGVSRTPVRESLRLLMAEGLVEQQLTGGARVVPLRPGDLAPIYDVRERLEGLMARDACLKDSGECRDELTQLIDLMERTREADSTFLDLGRRFHATIAEYADNPWCAHLLHQIRGQVDRYRARSTSQPGRASGAVDEHRAVVEAFVAGDPDEAEQAMRHHIQLSAQSAAGALRLDDWTRESSDAPGPSTL